MSIEPEVKKPDVRFLSSIASLKTLLLVSAVSVLAVSNVASLVSDSFHDLMYSGLRNALLLAGTNVAEAALRRSPAARAGELKGEMAKLTDENRNLVRAKEKLQADLSSTRAEAHTLKIENHKVKADLDSLTAKHNRHASTAKDIATKVKARLAKAVTRNVAAIPAETVPYIGVGFAISATALDIYDACQTVMNMNELLRMLGLPQENTSDVCGVVVPTTNQVLASLASTWQSSAKVITDAMKDLPVGVPIPVIKLPSLGEVKDAVCPIVRVPAFCP